MTGTLCIVLQNVNEICAKLSVQNVQKYWRNQCENIGVFYADISVNSMSEC